MECKIKEKRWSSLIEVDALKSWDVGTYRFNKNSGKLPFSIDTPPPYASGKWHVGGAAHYAQIDMIARYYRMRGCEVLFPLGIDRNGLPVEVEVEKKFKKELHSMNREEFLKLCKSFLDEVEGNIISIAKRLGMSCDFGNIYRTDDPRYRMITQGTFIEMWRRGLVYEDERPTNWCPVCKTTIADAEVEYNEVLTDLCYIRFKVEGGGFVVIATTRPELLCTCAVVIYNPKDERHAHLDGEKVLVPIFQKAVAVVPHPYAKPEFGTGLVMVCSYGDYGDVRIFREMGLAASVVIDEDGRMNDGAGPYKGLSVTEARKAMIRDLERQGLLEKVEKIKHRIPVCWRSRNPIEFISMKEYYLRQLPFLQDLTSLATSMEFYPEESRQLLLEWIGSISSDWPISRRRYYGTEVPIWYCKECGKAHVPEPGKYYQPWKDKAPFERCSCGSTDFIGEERIFDTWMDSSISQLFILGYGREEELFDKLYPCTVRTQGKDIVRTWLYYSILRTYQLLKGRAFNKVRISGMGLDEHGEAMHKSKGNVVYPESILDKYGADAFRLWSSMEGKLGSDYRFSEKRVEDAYKFLTKLWNVARFISMFPRYCGKYQLSATDKMILASLDELIRECQSGYESLDFFVPATSLRKFTWSLFADHYIECVKSRAYNESKAFDEGLQRGAWYTLHFCLQNILRLLAPICPFLADSVWSRVYGGNVHRESFPKTISDSRLDEGKLLEAFLEFNTTIWKFKKDRNLPLTAELDRVWAPESLKPMEKDLKSMHRIKQLSFGKAPAGSMELEKGVYVLD